jgi:hypothetical protein
VALSGGVKDRKRKKTASRIEAPLKAGYFTSIKKLIARRKRRCDLMKTRQCIISLVTILAIGLASCSDTGPEKTVDPSIVMGVAASATFFCIKSNSPGITLDSWPEFGDSQFAQEISEATGFSSVRVIFTNTSVAYDNKTYTINGTISLAMKFVPNFNNMTFTLDSYFYTEGLKIVGPGCEGTVTGDFKQNMLGSSTVVGNESVITINIKTNGEVCGRDFTGSNTTIVAKQPVSQSAT